MKSAPGPLAPIEIHIRLLGSFRAARDGDSISELESGRTRTLLAYLLLHRAAPTARPQLAYTLWPDTSDKQAHTNLRTLLSRLRRGLVDGDRFLAVTRGTVQLRTDAPLDADLFEFERLLAAADEARTDNERAQNLAQAVTIYRGDLLPDCYDDWIAPERERLRDLYLHALERLVAHHEEQRNYEAAIGQAQRLLRSDPLHEDTYHRLMRLHALNGDRAGALRVYHACVDTLQRELDVEPGARIKAAYQRLLHRETTVTTKPETRHTQAQLVGRNAEWTALIEAWRRARAGRPSMVAITGEAGMGKTRLAEEMVTWAERQGITVAAAHCHATESDLAYGPIAQWLQAAEIREQWADMDELWLGELARIVPQLSSDRPGRKSPDPLNARWQRQRLYEALARALLAGGRPLLLLIDDLQWSDIETLNWLTYFLQYDNHHPLFIVATVRLEDVTDEHRYFPFRLALQRQGYLAEIQLGPLSADETTTLAGGFSSQGLTVAQATELYRDTEGNPLFVVETMQVAQEDGHAGLELGAANQGSTPNLESLPAKVAAVLQQRLAQLSPSAQQLVQLAAVIGRTFTFDLLAEICEQNEDAVVDALDEAWRRRIIREDGVNAYDFSHDKLRATAYALLSPARRRRHHRHVAEALVRRYAGEPNVVSGQIARHFERAGLTAQAIPRYNEAAEAAQHVYANEDAITYCQRGIELFNALPAGSGGPEEIASGMKMRLLEGLGDVYMRVGQHDDARAAYRNALAQAPADDNLRKAIHLRKIGNTQSIQHRYEKALSSYHEAERFYDAAAFTADQQWQQSWIQLQLDLILLYYGTGDDEAQAELLQTARPAVMSQGTSIQRANFLECVAMLGMRQDRYAVSESTLNAQRSALAAWQETDAQSGIANNYFSLAFCHLWRRELDDAEYNIRSADKLAQQIGNDRVQTLCLTYSAVLHRFLGDVDGAQRFANKSLKMLEQSDIQFYVGMAKANLAWVAWRQRDFDLAAAHGREASQIMTQAYPFRWAALWPLIGVAIEHDDLTTAMNYARQMLDPSQQRLAQDLTRNLTAALTACEKSDVGAADAYLRDAVKIAVDQGYL